MAASVDALPDLERWADRLPGHEMLHLGTWVGQMAGGYPLDWIRDAILAAATADPKRLKQYALRCLINRKADLDKPTPPPEPERPELRPLRDPALPPPTVKRYVPRPPRGREASA